MITPLTGSLASNGKDVARMSEIIEKQLNLSSKKHSYKFIIQDGMCGAGAKATNSANMLINLEKVDYLITSCSGTTLQVAPISERKKIVTIAILSSHKDIKHLGDYIFRTFIDVENSIENFAKNIAKHSNNKLAVLTEENPFTFGIRDVILEEARNSIVYKDDFPANTSDFSSLLLKIKKSGAKGLYIGAVSGRTLADIIKQSKNLGLDIQIYNYIMPETTSYRDLVGKSDEGLIFLGYPLIKSSSKLYRDLYDQFVKTYNEKPDIEFLLRTLFNASYSLFYSIENIGNNPESVKNHLYRISFKGATGLVEYDKNGDIKNLDYVNKRIVNSKHTPYSFQ